MILFYWILYENIRANFYTASFFCAITVRIRRTGITPCVRVPVRTRAANIPSIFRDKAFTLTTIWGRTR